MSAENTQKTTHLDANYIFSLLPKSMPTLLRPPVNPAIASAVPELFQTISSAHPRAAANELDALHAGLWLLADDLEKAHSICQNIPTAHGSAWHAIMHRREGDFSNSKYWWRRASSLDWNVSGRPTLREQLESRGAIPAELAGFHRSISAGFDPAEFVDVVEGHQHASPDVTAVLVEAQRWEWAVLFERCLAAAAGA